MKVRKAIEADCDAMARIQASAMVASEYYDSSHDVDSESQRLHPRVSGYRAGTYHPSASLAERELVVATHDEKVVGFIAGHRSTRLGCDGELQWMFVLPEWQRMGVGARLLRPLRDWFVAICSTKIIIDAPPENPCRAFYLKHGAIPFDEHWLYWEDIREASIV